MKDCSVFKRGQVWWVDDNQKGIGSIQGKSRPYLIVSNDMCNANSPVIHMAPITSKSKIIIPTHVPVYDPYRKIDQIVLCEQTMPKSVPDIESVSTYRYTLSEDKMKEVDKALAIQFGITCGEVSIDDFEELLDMLKDKKIAEIRKEANKLTDSRAEAYVDKLLEAVDKAALDSVPKSIPSVDLPKDIMTHNGATPDVSERIDRVDEVTPDSTDDKPTSQIDKFNLRMQKTQKMQGKLDQPKEAASEVTTQRATGKRNRWTEKRKWEFIADAENPNISKSDILIKYSMSSKSYYTMLSKFRRELSVSTQAKSSDRVNDSLDLIGTTPEQFLEDYDSKPISEMMRLYNLPDKKSVVAKAALCQAQLGR